MKKGMALVTMVTVIVILSILSTTMVTSAIKSINNTKLYNFAIEVKTVQEYINAYKVDNDGKVPLGDTIYSIHCHNLREDLINDCFAGEIIEDWTGFFDDVDGTLHEISGLQMINLTELGIASIQNQGKNSYGNPYLYSLTTGKVYSREGQWIDGQPYYGLTDELRKMIGMSTDDEDYSSALKDGIAMYRSPSTPTKDGVTTEIKIPNTNSSGMDIEVQSVKMVQTNETLSLVTDGEYKVATANPTKSYKGPYKIEVIYKYKQTGGTEKITYSVSNADIEIPRISYDKVDFEFNFLKRKYDIVLTGLEIFDPGTGIKTVKYIDGDLENENIQEVARAVGEEINLNNYKISSKEEVFILYAEDYAGNFNYVRVTNVSSKEKTITPKMTSDMTPIKYESGSSYDTVTTTTVDDPEWFNYEERKWANAKTKDGSMWVWIPRFAYKIIEPGTEDKSAVSVILLKGNTNQYVADNGEVEDLPYGYTVHPAFRSENSSLYANGGTDKEISGFWMSKFEAGYAGIGEASSYTKYNSQTTYRTTNNVTNVYGKITKYSTKMPYPVFIDKAASYNYIAIGDAFNIGLELNRTGNPYGIPVGADTHMVKNSEWGAAVYLACSKYGTEEVFANTKTRTSSYPTSAYALAGYDGDGNLYTYTKSVLPSTTTGNSYGVVDMAGGCREFVSAHIKNGSGNIYTNAPSFTENDANLSSKHKSVYSYNSADTSIANFNEPVNLARKGEAIFETSNGRTTWQGGNFEFPHGDTPFFTRGGDKDDLDGSKIYTVVPSTGAPTPKISFRCVIIFD